RNIDVGGGTTGGDLNLSNAALGHVTAATLRIGRTDNAGTISVTAAIAPTPSTLDLRSGSTISQTSGSTVTATNLALQGAGRVSLGLANPVSEVAGSTTNAAYTFAATGA